MHSDGPLTPAARADALFAVWFALRRLPAKAKTNEDAAAEAVVATLERHGFVFMRKPALPMPGLAPEPPPI